MRRNDTSNVPSDSSFEALLETIRALTREVQELRQEVRSLRVAFHDLSWRVNYLAGSSENGLEERVESESYLV